jgi:hypothetical protein
MQSEKPPLKRRMPRATAAILAAGLALPASGCSAKADSFEGGCGTFGVYAQNRWKPFSAAIRTEPDVLAPKVEQVFAPNEVIAVDGWIDTKKPVYPRNTPPWNSSKWFHVVNLEKGEDGWVSFAGVRGEPTTPDPTNGQSRDGGKPAPTTPECEGTYDPQP